MIMAPIETVKVISNIDAINGDTGFIIFLTTRPYLKVLNHYKS